MIAAKLRVGWLLLDCIVVALLMTALRGLVLAIVWLAAAAALMVLIGPVLLLSSVVRASRGEANP